MRFITAAMSGDFHSAAVGVELRRRGHVVDEFFGEDLPERMEMSAGRGRHNFMACQLIGSLRSSWSLDDADVVWNRRRVAFTMPGDIHPDDQMFARAEIRAFSDSVWASVSPRAYWVNPQDGALRARHKLAQLDTAARVGLVIPETLITNSPEDARAFIRSNAPNRTIYKSLKPGFWEDRGVLRSLMATLVTEDDLGSDESFRLCPGIFQRCVPKSYEVRLTVFGRTILGLKLNSASNSQTVDCREQYLSPGFAHEPYDTPAWLRERIFALMDGLGIRFGCVDLAIDDSGDACFFEVNEAGQFLWLEELQPRIPMLDAFCCYLESQDDAFEYRGSVRPASILSLGHELIHGAMRPLVAVQPS